MKHQYIEPPTAHNPGQSTAYLLREWGYERASYIRRYKRERQGEFRAFLRRQALHYSRLVRKLEGRA